MEVLELIPAHEVRRSLRIADSRTLRRALARHNVPLTTVSAAVKGLTPDNYRLLIERMTQPVEAK